MLESVDGQNGPGTNITPTKSMLAYEPTDSVTSTNIVHYIEISKLSASN